MTLHQRSDLADSLLSWSELVVLFSKLAVVLTLIYLVFWMIKRQNSAHSSSFMSGIFVRLKAALNASSAVKTSLPVNIIWSRSVAPAVSLYLLAIGERCILISVTTQEVKVLLELSDKESNTLLHQGDIHGHSQL